MKLNRLKGLLKKANGPLVPIFRLLYEYYFPQKLPSLVDWTAKRVLVISPHIDDEAIGALGAIMDHIKELANVTILYCSQGGNSQEKAARKAEALKACQTMKATPLFLDWPSLGFANHQKAPNELSEILLQVKPEVIYLPFPIDQNPDHVAVNFHLHEALTARLKGHSVRLRFYSVISCLTPYVANKAVNITKYLRLKRKLLFDVYVSQTMLLDMERFLVINKIQGSHLKTHAAELYVEIEPDKWGKLLSVIKSFPRYYLPTKEEPLFSWKHPMRMFFNLAERQKRVKGIIGGEDGEEIL